MSPTRLPRWTALLILPLLAGALLLMHGLDPRTTTTGLDGSAAHTHHDEAPAEHHDAGCEGCTLGHVMAACVAIVVTVVSLSLARRAAGTPLPALVDTAASRVRAARQLLRPPEPAWVRLAVMRC